MNLADALKIANKIRSELLPFCERCEIAGSVRRRKLSVNDIEIVYMPKQIEALQYIDRHQKIRGRATGKYTRRLIDSMGVDFFSATPDNWGLIFAIRTGSAEYSHKILARGWVKAGFKSANGFLTKVDTGARVPVREETNLFEIIGIPYCIPKDREI